MKTTAGHCLYCRRPILYDDDEDRYIFPTEDCVRDCPEHGDALVVGCPECQNAAHEAGITIQDFNGGHC